MAGRGPAPKPAHLRQRANRKAGSATLVHPETTPHVPPIPNPDGREWHPLTTRAWEHAWTSPMAELWLETDRDALGRLAVLWDAFYRGDIRVMQEIRLQEQRFGLSPLDRSRLQWEIRRGEEPAPKEPRKATRTRTDDPRRFLMAVK